MPGLLRMLQQDSREVAAGTVTGRLSDSRYRVRVAGKVVPARAGVSGELPVGARVIVSLTGEGRTIIGREKFMAREVLEVVVDG